MRSHFNWQGQWSGSRRKKLNERNTFHALDPFEAICPAVPTVVYFMFLRSNQCLHYNEEHWGHSLKGETCHSYMHRLAPKSTVKPCLLSESAMKQAIF